MHVRSFWFTSGSLRPGGYALCESGLWPMKIGPRRKYTRDVLYMRATGDDRMRWDTPGNAACSHDGGETWETLPKKVRWPFSVRLKKGDLVRFASSHLTAEEVAAQKVSDVAWEKTA